MPRAEGPFEVLEKGNDNPHKIDLPSAFQVSATFNATDLGPYEDDHNLANLRLNSTKQGKDDGDASWSSSQAQDEGLDRAHHDLLTMEDSPHPCTTWFVP